MARPMPQSRHGSQDDRVTVCPGGEPIRFPQMEPFASDIARANISPEGTHSITPQGPIWKVFAGGHPRGGNDVRSVAQENGDDSGPFQVPSTLAMEPRSGGKAHRGAAGGEGRNPFGE